MRDFYKTSRGTWTFRSTYLSRPTLRPSAQGRSELSVHCWWTEVREPRCRYRQHGKKKKTVLYKFRFTIIYTGPKQFTLLFYTYVPFVNDRIFSQWTKRLHGSLKLYVFCKVKGSDTFFVRLKGRRVSILL